MIKNYKKITTHTVTGETIVGRNLYCDCCGKQIVGKGPVGCALYYEVDHGHGDWGNDSCDSYEHEDICSFECLQKSMENFYCKEEPVSSTAFYHIDRSHWFTSAYKPVGDEEEEIDK